MMPTPRITMLAVQNRLNIFPKENSHLGICLSSSPSCLSFLAPSVNKIWDKDGVFNIEEFDPDPFMEMLNEYGLPWVVEENPEVVR